MLTKPDVSIPDTAPGDPRIGQILGRGGASGAPGVALIGFPCDEGVRRNGGRPGSAQAPARIRHWLYRMTPDATQAEAFTRILSSSSDLGDVCWEGDLAAGQQALAEVVAPLLVKGVIPVILGGGHETSYGHFLGYVLGEKQVSIVNLDAHCDVRELRDGLGHSGSPFRQACEHSSRRCGSYIVAGLQPHSVAVPHLEYVTAHGEYLFRSEVGTDVIATLYDRSGGCVLASFDIDAVDQAFAPGVSAPATSGLDVAVWLGAARAAGRSPKVTSMDLVEVNPSVDQDDQTSRLAALTVWQFLAGLAERTAL